MTVGNLFILLFVIVTIILNIVFWLGNGNPYEFYDRRTHMLGIYNFAKFCKILNAFLAATLIGYVLYLVVDNWNKVII